VRPATRSNPMRSPPCSRVARHHDGLRPGSCRAPKLSCPVSCKAAPVRAPRPRHAGRHPRPVRFRARPRRRDERPAHIAQDVTLGRSDSVQGRDAETSALPKSRKTSRPVGPIPGQAATPRRAAPPTSRRISPSAGPIPSKAARQLERPAHISQDFALGWARFRAGPRASSSALPKSRKTLHPAGPIPCRAATPS